MRNSGRVTLPGNEEHAVAARSSQSKSSISWNRRHSRRSPRFCSIYKKNKNRFRGEGAARRSYLCCLWLSAIKLRAPDRRRLLREIGAGQEKTCANAYFTTGFSRRAQCMD